MSLWLDDHGHELPHKLDMRSFTVSPFTYQVDSRAEFQRLLAGL